MIELSEENRLKALKLIKLVSDWFYDKPRGSIKTVEWANEGFLRLPESLAELEGLLYIEGNCHVCGDAVMTPVIRAGSLCRKCFDEIRHSRGLGGIDSDNSK